MDYLRAKYDLELVKNHVLNKGLVMTRKVMTDALSQFGFDESHVKETILKLETSHFFKSMDSSINHKIRQDVYHFPHKNGFIYIKFQLININHLVIMLIILPLLMSRPPWGISKRMVRTFYIVIKVFSFVLFVVALRSRNLKS